MSTLQRKDVLIVDDDDAIRRMLVMSLSRMELICATAADGAEALEEIGRTRYAVILLDLMMPRLDGQQFVEVLKAMEGPATDGPLVLVMTAYAPLETSDRLGPRVHAIVQKPFDVVQLAELIRDCVEGLRNLPTGTGRGGRVTGPSPDPAGAPRRRS